MQNQSSNRPRQNHSKNAPVRTTSHSHLISFILFNLFAFKGYHLKTWKNPKYMFLNKSDKPQSNPYNYRTIQLINTIAKALEKLMNQELYIHATTYQHINPEQAAYQFNKGCDDKIFQAAQFNIQAIQQRQICSTIFMDVEKAFDKVQHNILLHILITKHFPARLIRFIASFLKNRSTQFIINSILSGTIDILIGVPQGSCLSALLFIIFFAYIPTPEHLEQDPTKCIGPHRKLNKPALVTQFADDIKTLNAGAQITRLHKNLQATLNCIDKFIKQRGSKINATKTKELITTRKHIEKPIPQLTFNGHPIAQVPHARFLGIIFDNKATFKNHINDVLGRAKHRTIKLKSTIRKTYGPSNKTAIRLYKVYNRSMYEYGKTGTIAASDILIKKLETDQVQMARHILGINFLSNKLTLELANLPSMRDRIDFLAAKWYNKVLQTNNQPILDFIELDVYPSYTKDSPYHRIIKAHAKWFPDDQ